MFLFFTSKKFCWIQPGNETQLSEKLKVRQWLHTSSAVTARHNEDFQNNTKVLPPNYPPTLRQRHSSLKPMANNHTLFSVMNFKDSQMEWLKRLSKIFESF